MPVGTVRPALGGEDEVDQRRMRDEDDWIQPPACKDGGVPWVDVRFDLNKVNAVDTVTSTACFKVYTIFYWTDPRLAGWPEGKALPMSLWGPRFFLNNALNDGLAEFDGEFALIDNATGRLKRGRNYSGTVDNPMDLRNFPFDLDGIKLRFLSASDWESLDGSRKGNSAKGKSYQLRRICAEGEGTFLHLMWSGRIAEWQLHGISSKIVEHEVVRSGCAEVTDIQLSFHVSRKSGYYFWKALVPLYLLTTLSMGTFHFETENLPDRYSTVSTFFLAAFAMLYVVGEALPRTDFLTKIDIVIVISTVSLAITGIASLILAKVHKEMGQEVADRWNFIVEVGLIAFYVLANLVIFVPAWLAQRSAVAQLDGYPRPDYAQVGGTSGSENNPMFDAGAGGGMPPTVEKGCDYVTVEDIKRSVE